MKSLAMMVQASSDFPLEIKNTFISVGGGPDFEDEDALFAAPIRPMAKRQMTEPLPKRQVSMNPPLKAVLNAYEISEPVEPEQEPRKDSEDGDDDEDDYDLTMGNDHGGNDWNRLVTGDDWKRMTTNQSNVGQNDAMYSSNAAQCMPYGAPQMYAPQMWPTWNIPSGELPPMAQMQPPEWATTYTVMMRNLPNKYTQSMLLEEINSCGFLGCYDFLYLPIDTESHANRGYSFINFIDPSVAWKFKLQFEGSQMRHFNSGKFVTVTPAALQGFEANHAHYANARVSRGAPDARPLFLREPASSNQAGAAKAGQAAPRRRRGGRRSLIDQAAAQLVHTNPKSAGYQKEQLMSVSADNTTAASSSDNDNQDAGSTADSGGKPATAALAPPAGAKLAFCPYCGGKVANGFKFCQFCGSSLCL